MSLTEVAALPLREKFQIMEAIWADLSQRVEEFEIPAEHRALLDARRERVATGESTLHDWDAVKHTIGQRGSGSEFQTRLSKISLMDSGFMKHRKRAWETTFQANSRRTSRD